MAPVVVEHSEFSHTLFARATTARSSHSSQSLSGTTSPLLSRILIPFFKTYLLRSGLFDVRHVSALAGAFSGLLRKRPAKN